jgi:hypothetical protein
MQPWKMFVRSVSVVTVLTAGGFAAGQSVLPFSTTSRITSPQVTEGDDTATGTDTPAVDPAAEVVDESTTTTTTETPKADPPAVDPVEDPAPTKPPAVDTPDESDTTTTTGAPAPEPIKVTVAPDPEPVDCHVRFPDKGDHNGDGHCDNGWHNKDAEWIATHEARAHGGDSADDDHGRPESAGQPKNGERPEQAPGQVKNGGRPDSAPGHTK